ncbi:hypothetical protein FHS27_002901 [Rhodopirellula rubra]|uniref:Uncharacterized protein n=1 Tax=Aporhodopirellula rubra TaxID=980271 RepID=A0A7W5H552_9BACT|nr:hypothetical protein [Aporhodopirellula rubra]MBB3207082.1 hypothetical protein [Aporhodopirellula rubra]
MLSEKTIRIVEGIRGRVVGDAVTLTRRFHEWGLETNSKPMVFFYPACQRTGDQRKAIPGAIDVWPAPFDTPAVMTTVGEFAQSAEVGTVGGDQVIDGALLPGNCDDSGFVTTESTREWILFADRLPLSVYVFTRFL